MSHGGDLYILQCQRISYIISDIIQHFLEWKQLISFRFSIEYCILWSYISSSGIPCHVRYYPMENQWNYRCFHPRKISFNSLALGKFEWNFRHAIFKQILVIAGWGISCDIAIIWMSLGFADDQSTLVQGLVPSGNKPLPEPLLTQISVNIWHHKVTMF